MNLPIPSIDLSLPKEEIVVDLTKACRNVGFFYLINHGVDQTLIDDVFAQSKAFFNLSLQEKLKVKMNEKGRGYTPFGNETLDPESSSRDFREKFQETQRKVITSAKKFRSRTTEVRYTSMARISGLTKVPFFFEPDYNCLVECIPTCCDENNPPRYKPITAGQYLLDKYKATHEGF